MSEAHFSKFEAINTGEFSTLSVLEDGAWGRLFDFRVLVTLANYFKPYRLKSGQTLFEQGDGAGFVCLIASGTIEVFKEDTSGQLKKLINMKAGKTLGEMSLIDGEPRSATCRAGKEAEVLILDEARFEALKEAHPQVALALVTSLAKEISRRLRRTTGTLLASPVESDHLLF